MLPPVTRDGRNRRHDAASGGLGVAAGPGAEPGNGGLRLALALMPPLWADVLSRMLEQVQGVAAVQRVGSADELARLPVGRLPDVVLLDYEALGTGAQTLIARLRRTLPELRLLVLAPRAVEETALAVLCAGAAGLVATQLDFATLLTAVRAVASGEVWAQRRVASLAIERLAAAADRDTNGAPSLTRREWQVVEAVQRGLQNREIASTLGISQHTVKTHLASIFGKLGVNSRLAIARWAADQGGTPA